MTIYVPLMGFLFPRTSPGQQVTVTLLLGKIRTRPPHDVQDCCLAQTLHKKCNFSLLGQSRPSTAAQLAVRSPQGMSEPFLS